MPYVNDVMNNAGLGQRGDQAKSIAQYYADALKTQEEIEAERREKWKQMADNGGILGGDKISRQGQEMQNIAARFVDNAVNALEDPAFDMIQFQIDWSDKTGLFASETEQGSALHYLQSTGEEQRYAELKQVHTIFKELFDATSAAAPKSYYLSSVDGLGSLNENYTKRGIDSEVTLHCLDDIKWYIRTAKMLLNDIFYDAEKQIEILPKNLRRFTCMLFISDIRDLTDIDINGASIANPQKPADWQNKTDEQREAWLAEQANKQRLFYGGGKSNMPDMKQCVQITSFSCYIRANNLPDAVSNIEQTELNGDLTLLMRSYALLNVNHVLQSAMLTMPPEVAQNAGAGFNWKNFATAYSAKLIGSVVNSAINVAQNFASGMLNQFLDNIGFKDFVNTVTRYTKPETLMQELGGMLDNAVNNPDKDKSDYFPERPVHKAYSANGATGASGYSSNLGSIDN